MINDIKLSLDDKRSPSFISRATQTACQEAGSQLTPVHKEKKDWKKGKNGAGEN